MNINMLFSDKILTSRIQERLPELFYIAELKSSRAGRVGMEVGSAREKIVIALLIYKFGQENIDTDIPITEPEVDVRLLGDPLSIKTITGRKLGGVKIVWTVDAEQALRFSLDYTPKCGMLLVQVNWDDLGGVFFFQASAQGETMQRIGRQNYIKLPKTGTNPRGVEISVEALEMLARHPQSQNIPIRWHRKTVDYNPYDRWLGLWRKD